MCQGAAGRTQAAKASDVCNKSPKKVLEFRILMPFPRPMEGRARRMGRARDSTCSPALLANGLTIPLLQLPACRVESATCVKLCKSWATLKFCFAAFLFCSGFISTFQVRYKEARQEVSLKMLVSPSTHFCPVESMSLERREMQHIDPSKSAFTPLRVVGVRGSTERERERAREERLRERDKERASESKRERDSVSLTAADHSGLGLCAGAQGAFSWPPNPPPIPAAAKEEEEEEEEEEEDEEERESDLCRGSTWQRPRRPALARALSRGAAGDVVS